MGVLSVRLFAQIIKLDLQNNERKGTNKPKQGGRLFHVKLII